jgi:hypothetical protein
MERIEKAGWDVHWPPRDTNQVDDTGLKICTENWVAIKDAEVVYFVWDGKSQGCLFDLGMAFAMNKMVIPLELPEPTDGKSFQNMVTAYKEKMFNEQFGTEALYAEYEAEFTE